MTDKLILRNEAEQKLWARVVRDGCTFNKAPHENAIELGDIVVAAFRERCGEDKATVCPHCGAEFDSSVPADEQRALLVDSVPFTRAQMAEIAQALGMPYDDAEAYQIVMYAKRLRDRDLDWQTQYETKVGENTARQAQVAESSAAKCDDCPQLAAAKDAQIQAMTERNAATKERDAAYARLRDWLDCAGGKYSSPAGGYPSLTYRTERLLDGHPAAVSTGADAHHDLDRQAWHKAGFALTAERDALKSRIADLEARPEVPCPRCAQVAKIVNGRDSE